MTTAAIDALTRRVAGPVLRPRDEDYAGELAGFDLAVDQCPVVVVGATGPADMIAAIRHARDAGLTIGAQATGHGITVPADDALLITTRRADAVRVDPADRTAWLEAGAVWTRALHEAAPFGLAPLAGSAPDVGAVSYTLGGGLGVLGRRWGSPPTTCAGSTWSPPMAGCGWSPPTSTRTCSGPCAEAAATSASSPGCRSSWWTWPSSTVVACSSPAKRLPRSSPRCSTSVATPPTRSACRPR